MAKKDSYYFTHDSDATEDPKIMVMMSEWGLEAYGIYWIIIEHLRKQPEYKSRLTILKALASRYGSTEEKFKSVVVRYDLFVVDNEDFFSLSLIRRMEPLLEKREKMRELAERRWSKDTQAMRTHSAGNASKVKESKEENSIIYDLTSNPLGLFICVKDATKQNIKIYQQSLEKYLEGTFAGAYEGQKISLRNLKPPIEEFFKRNNGNIYNDNQHLWSAFKKLWVSGGGTRPTNYKVQ